MNSQSSRGAVRLVVAAAVIGGSLAIITQPVSAVPPSVTGYLDVTQSSPVSILSTLDPNDPVTSSLNLDVANHYADLDTTAEVTLTGTSPGKLSLLDRTGLTVTTETNTSLVFSGTGTAVVTALESQLEWESPQSPGTVNLDVEVTQDLPDDVLFNSTTGHLYLADPDEDRDRSGANSYVSGLDDLWGLDAHLVTITSAQEQTFLKDGIDGTDSWWIGAEDTSGSIFTGGEWKWIAGPENNSEFWAPPQSIGQQGLYFGSKFAWWGNDQPSNDSWIPCLLCLPDYEDDATFNASTGEWNDTRNDNSYPVLVEFSSSTTDEPNIDSLDVDLTATSRHLHLIDYADNNATTTEFPTAPDANAWTQTGATFRIAESSGVGTMSTAEEDFAVIMNTFLARNGLDGSNVDTQSEVQAIIDAYRLILEYAESGGRSTAPDASVYATLGFGEFNERVVRAMNQSILEAGPAGLGSASMLQTLLTEVGPRPNISFSLPSWLTDLLNSPDPSSLPDTV